jgi:hypothetical protein
MYTSNYVKRAGQRIIRVDGIRRCGASLRSKRWFVFVLAFLLFLNARTVAPGSPGALHRLPFRAFAQAATKPSAAAGFEAQ